MEILPLCIFSCDVRLSFSNDVILSEESNADGITLQIIYKLDIATVLIAQDNYDDARETLDEILNNEDIGFNEKNTAEELMGFVSQKLGI